MKILGIDPDTKSTGLALIDFDNNKVEVALARAVGRLEPDRRVQMALALDLMLTQFGFPDAAVIEWQHLRPGRERNPNAMMGVQAVAGMALGLISGLVPENRIFTPLPNEWRGTQSKEIVQARFLAELGLTLDSPVFAKIPSSMRTHTVDGLGLALWGRKKLAASPSSLRLRPFGR